MREGAGESGEGRPISTEHAIEILRSGEIEILGLFQDSSNYTFLARAGTSVENVLVVYKPRDGETPLWDFPDGTLYKREAAAFVVSEALGFSFVPPTIVREGPHGIGSVQLFINADESLHYLNMPAAYDDVFRRVCLFDLIINNADRKAGHCLLETATDRVWMVDHGVSFHVQPKLRTVIWDYAGESVPPGSWQPPEKGGMARLLGDLLSPPEIAALERRIEEVSALDVFPEPGPGRPYPWPPV
ncbi:MAG: SCO1664 family protein [Actinomycetota bacterium]